jgi:1-aminocyclopropane-1-carboxylate deaminase/D-cysteine desulfhydrase-like pyridoxal-dependent ACC family enzyme
MECVEAIEQTKKQTYNIPFNKINRIVIPVGSCMSLLGVLHGLFEQGIDVPVFGVCVGAKPDKTLKKYSSKEMRKNLELCKSPYKYSTPFPISRINNIRLDPIYEAKCLPFLEDGDLFWIVGIRNMEHAP